LRCKQHKVEHEEVLADEVVDHDGDQFHDKEHKQKSLLSEAIPFLVVGQDGEGEDQGEVEDLHEDEGHLNDVTLHLLARGGFWETLLSRVEGLHRKG